MAISSALITSGIRWIRAGSTVQPYLRCWNSAHAATSSLVRTWDV